MESASLMQLQLKKCGCLFVCLYKRVQQREHLFHSLAPLEKVGSQITTNIYRWLVGEVIRDFNRLPHVEKQLVQWYTWWLKFTIFG